MKNRAVAALLLSVGLVTSATPAYAADIQAVSEAEEADSEIDGLIATLTGDDPEECGWEAYDGEPERGTLIVSGDGRWVCLGNGLYRDVETGMDVSYADGTYYTYIKQDPEYSVPEGLTAEYGDRLSSVVLPDGFSWSADVVLSDIGDNVCGVTYTPDNTLMYNTVQGIEVTVDVRKKTVTELPEPSVGTLTYDPGRALADIALPDGWEWEDPDTVPSVAVSSYRAVYAADTEHYDYTGLELERDVSITILPADAELEDTYAFQILTGQTLADIELPEVVGGTLSWAGGSGEALAKGIYTFYLNYTPDTADYNRKYGIPVAVLVTDEPVTEPTGLTGRYGETLGSIGLPDGFSWADGTVTLDAVGTQHYPAVYTTDGGGSFSFSLEVEVGKGVAPAVVKPESVSEVWSEGIVAGDVTLPAHWSFADPDAGLDVGTVTLSAVYTPTDADLYDYNPDNLTADVEVTITKAYPAYTKPASITAKKGAVLKDSMLPDGFKWMSVKTAESTGTYYCKYVPDDTDHYNVVTDIPVRVVVAKASSVQSTQDTSGTSTSDSTADTSATASSTTSSTPTASSSTSSSSSDVKISSESTESDTDGTSTSSLVALNEGNDAVAVDHTMGDMVVEDATDEVELEKDGEKVRPASDTEEDTEEDTDGEESTDEDGVTTYYFGGDDDSDGGEDEAETSSHTGLIAAVLAVVAGAIAFILKKRKAEGPEEEPDDAV